MMQYTSTILHSPPRARSFCCTPLSFLLLVLALLSLQPKILVTSQGTALDDGSPRLAHPPNQIHFDRRYGIAVGPNQELFTGDVIVLTVEDNNPYDGSPIFNVWSVNDAGQITCIDPLASTPAPAAQQQYTSNAYASSGYDEPTYGGETAPAWSPSLAHMFVVNIVDGRLGQFYLSPVVTFPQSPKYITPQPNRPRTGVASAIGSDGWALGEDEVLAINAFTAPGDPMFGYSIGFYYHPDSAQYRYREPLKGRYGNTNPSGHNMYTSSHTGTNAGDTHSNSNRRTVRTSTSEPVTGERGTHTSGGSGAVQGRFRARGYAHTQDTPAQARTRASPASSRSPSYFTRSKRAPTYPTGASLEPNKRMQTSSSSSQYGYTAPTQYGASSYDDAEGYEDGGRIAIRGSSTHGFCRCDNGFVLCYNIGQPTLMYPDPSNLAPVFSWFKVNKIPSQVVRKLMENYASVVSAGLPRTFLLFTAMPFTDRVDALHFHGAEAMLSSRRVRLGQMRLTCRGTRLEQQTTLVLRNLVSDTVVFTFAIGIFQAAAFVISDLPLVPIITPFARTQPRQVMMLSQRGRVDSGLEEGSEEGAVPGQISNGAASGGGVYNWREDRESYAQILQRMNEDKGDGRVDRHPLGGGGVDEDAASVFKSGSHGSDGSTTGDAEGGYASNSEKTSQSLLKPGILQDYSPDEHLYLKTHSQAHGIKPFMGMSVGADGGGGNGGVAMVKPSIGRPPAALILHGAEVEEEVDVSSAPGARHGQAGRRQREREEEARERLGRRKHRDGSRVRYDILSHKQMRGKGRCEGSASESGGGSGTGKRGSGKMTHKQTLRTRTHTHPQTPGKTGLSQSQSKIPEQIVNLEKDKISENIEESEHAKAVSRDLVHLMSNVVRSIAVAKGHDILCDRSDLGGGIDDSGGGHSSADVVSPSLGVCVDAWVLTQLGLDRAVHAHDIELSNEYGRASLPYLSVQEPWQARVAVLRSRASLAHPHNHHRLASTPTAQQPRTHPGAQLHAFPPSRTALRRLDSPAAAAHPAAPFLLTSPVDHHLYTLLQTAAAAAGASVVQLMNTDALAHADIQRRDAAQSKSGVHVHTRARGPPASRMPSATHEDAHPALSLEPSPPLALPTHVYTALADHLSALEDADRAVLLVGVLAAHYNSNAHQRGARQLSKLLVAMQRDAAAPEAVSTGTTPTHTHTMATDAVHTNTTGNAASTATTSAAAIATTTNSATTRAATTTAASAGAPGGTISTTIEVSAPGEAVNRNDVKGQDNAMYLADRGGVSPPPPLFPAAPAPALNYPSSDSASSSPIAPSAAARPALPHTASRNSTYGHTDPHPNQQRTRDRTRGRTLAPFALPPHHTCSTDGRKKHFFSRSSIRKLKKRYQEKSLNSEQTTLSGLFRPFGLGRSTPASLRPWGNSDIEIHVGTSEVARRLFALDVEEEEEAEDGRGEAKDSRVGRRGQEMRMEVLKAGAGRDGATESGQHHEEDEGAGEDEHDGHMDDDHEGDSDDACIVDGGAGVDEAASTIENNHDKCHNADENIYFGQSCDDDIHNCCQHDDDCDVEQGDVLGHDGSGSADLNSDVAHEANLTPDGDDSEEGAGLEEGGHIEKREKHDHKDDEDPVLIPTEIREGVWEIDFSRNQKFRNAHTQLLDSAYTATSANIREVGKNKHNKSGITEIRSKCTHRKKASGQRSSCCIDRKRVPRCGKPVRTAATMVVDERADAALRGVGSVSGSVAAVTATGVRSAGALSEAEVRGKYSGVVTEAKTGEAAQGVTRRVLALRSSGNPAGAEDGGDRDGWTCEGCDGECGEDNEQDEYGESSSRRQKQVHNKPVAVGRKEAGHSQRLYGYDFPAISNPDKSSSWSAQEISLKASEIQKNPRISTFSSGALQSKTMSIPKRTSARPTPIAGPFGLSAEDQTLLSSLPTTRRMRTMQTNFTVLDAVSLGEEFRLDFTHSWTKGSVIEFAGEYAMIVSPNTAHVGHVIQHIGYSTMPFTLDLVRQEYYWPAQWVADMHLPAHPVEIAATAGFSAFGVRGREMVTLREGEELGAEVSAQARAWPKDRLRKGEREVVPHDSSAGIGNSDGGDGNFDADIADAGARCVSDEAFAPSVGPGAAIGGGAGRCDIGAHTSRAKHSIYTQALHATTVESMVSPKSAQTAPSGHGGAPPSAANSSVGRSSAEVVRTRLDSGDSTPASKSMNTMDTGVADRIDGAGMRGDGASNATMREVGTTSRRTGAMNAGNRGGNGNGTGSGTGRGGGMHGVDIDGRGVVVSSSTPYRYYAWDGAPIDIQAHSHARRREHVPQGTQVRTDALVRASVLANAGVSNPEGGDADSVGGSEAAVPIASMNTMAAPHMFSSTLLTPASAASRTPKPVSAPTTPPPALTSSSPSHASTSSRAAHSRSLDSPSSASFSTLSRYPSPSSRRPYASKLEAALPRKRKHRHTRARRNPAQSIARRNLGETVGGHMRGEGTLPREHSDVAFSHNHEKAASVRKRTPLRRAEKMTTTAAEQDTKVPVECGLRCVGQEGGTGAHERGQGGVVHATLASGKVNVRGEAGVEVTLGAEVTETRSIHLECGGDIDASVNGGRVSPACMEELGAVVNASLAKGLGTRTNTVNDTGVVVGSVSDVEVAGHKRRGAETAVAAEKARRIAHRLARENRQNMQGRAKTGERGEWRDQWRPRGNRGESRGDEESERPIIHERATERSRSTSSNIRKGSRNEWWSRAQYDDGVYRLISRYRYTAGEASPNTSINRNKGGGPRGGEGPEKGHREGSELDGHHNDHEISPQVRATLPSTRTAYTPFQSSTTIPGALDATCLNPFASNLFADFTVRRASVEQELYSLVNPLGLVHPAYEFHHFAISGVYSATNTFFIEFVVERVS